MCFVVSPHLTFKCPVVVMILGFNWREIWLFCHSVLDKYSDQIDDCKVGQTVERSDIRIYIGPDPTTT